MRKLSHKLHNFFSVRVLACGISLCLMTGLLASCSSGTFLKKKIDVPEMARLLVDSIQDIKAAENFYNKIPEEQRDGLTYSEYYEYIGVISEMMPGGSSVTSFDIVEGQERETLLSSMLSSNSEEYDSMIRSCIPIRVDTTGQRESGTPMYFYLQTKESGEVYLDREWIRSCIDLYAFSVHYFEAYTNKNLTDVISLLPFTETPEPLPDSRDVLKAKAKEMIRFYTYNVKSQTEFEMISIDASNLLYLQPEVLDTQFKTSTRNVQFRSDDNSVISVVDPIQNELKSVDLYLYYNGLRTVRIGEHAAPSQLSNLFGTPITISCGPIMETKANGDEMRNILIRYDGFVITVYGTYTNEEEWDGRYMRFRIWDSTRARIGTEMDVNESSWDILMRYPFADETGFVLSVESDGEDYVLTVDLNREKANAEGSFPVRQIVLEWKKV
ncbi:MAG: hypothetical protein IK020_02885 [Clostridiales bacterium]|nr:hypothetical protein [Clostridiales bacterium]